MAGVPKYDDFRVNPTGPSNAEFSAPDTSAFAENGRQLARTGATIQQAGEQYGKIVLDEQNKANDLRVIDAENQAREAAIHLTVDEGDGYSNLKGGDVMHVDGQPLADSYAARFSEKLSDIAGGLSNDAQREAFHRSAAALHTDFYGRAKQYEASEYRGWQQSVLKGSTELSAQEIALHYNDPDVINSRLSSLDVAVAKLGQLNGMSGDETTALQNTARSEALSQAITSALGADDVGTAQSLFDSYGDKLLAPDRVKIEGPLKREAMGKTALAIGDAVFNTVPGTGADQPGVERVFNALVGQESGGRAGVAGPMTKYGQAHGLTQVLDSTGQGIAKKLGIQWRPELMRGRSAEAKEYQLRIGRAYFQEGLQKYGGDFYKALCYFHGGPDQKQWGPKTHHYADTILAHCGVKNGASGQPVAGTLEDALSAGRRMLLQANPSATTDQIKAVDDEVTHRWQVHKTSTDQADEQTLSGAMKQLLQNGGDINALDAATRNALPGDKYDSLVSFANSVRSYGKDKRDPTHDDASTTSPCPIPKRCATPAIPTSSPSMPGTRSSPRSPTTVRSCAARRRPARTTAARSTTRPSTVSSTAGSKASASTRRTTRRRARSAPRAGSSTAPSPASSAASAAR
jgi:hypothetical protein